MLRILLIETTSLKGRLRMLQRRIPPLPRARSGRPFLDWEQGMPLHMFLALLCRNDELRRPTLLEDLVDLHSETVDAE